jgi:PPOX class probable F420-dependent enzyme
MTSTEPGSALLSDKGLAALVTIKRDGRPQLSPIGYAYDREAGLIRISVTDGRAKTHNLRRDPRATLYLNSADNSSYQVVEGTAELTPVAQDPHDATVEELVAQYRQVAGEHPDWDEFRATMVTDRRLIIRLHVDRSYGSAAG